MSVLLDTHVLLWWKGASERLSRSAHRAISRADAILVSPVTLWEVATLLRLGRIALDRELFTWVRDLMAEPDVQFAALSAQAAAAAGQLPDAFPGDPADRLIYATGQDLRASLVSKDERLREYARQSRDLEVVW